MWLQASAKGLGLFPPSPALMDKAIRTKLSGQPWPPPPQGWAAEFHRSVTRVDANLACVSVVLCDDKPNSFGAPDVLQVGSDISFIAAEALCRHEILSFIGSITVYIRSGQRAVGLLCIYIQDCRPIFPMSHCKSSSLFRRSY